MLRISSFNALYLFISSNIKLNSSGLIKSSIKALDICDAIVSSLVIALSLIFKCFPAFVAAFALTKLPIKDIPPVIAPPTSNATPRGAPAPVASIQRYFEEEIKQRQAFSKKYFRIAKIINTIDRGLITVTVCAEDLAGYITIMHITKATYDKNNKRVGGNDKMNKLIKPLVKALEEDNSGNKLITEINKHFGFEEETDEEEEEEYEEPALIPFTPTKGTGLKRPKILPSDPNALIDRFDLLFSSKKAGHTGVRNEIVSILDELKRQGVLKTNEYKKLNSLI